jgi:DNA-directed RNA polymerase subunit F
MAPITRLRWLPTAALLAAFSFAPLATAEEVLEWDQERVTELSGELAAAISALRRTERKDPAGVVSTQRRAWDSYLQTLRSLEQSSNNLNRRLESGEGRDQTLAVARRIRSLVRDAETELRRIDTSEQSRAKLEPADALLRKIARYYFEE